MTPVDLVIPAHEKDFPVLEKGVRSALRHLSPIGQVHVVSAAEFSWPDDRVRWSPEPVDGAVPSLSDVAKRFADASGVFSRASWVYQQLLKLGAGSYIADLSSSYLVIDADVIFLRPVTFDPAQVGRFPYSRAYEHHLPYREAYERLFGTPPTASFSLTAHHMLYDRDLLAQMQEDLERRHEVPWFWAYVDTVDPAEASSISEMDIYGWWVLQHHPELARLRQLSWRDVRVAPGALGRAAFAADFDFVAAHAWYRQTRLERYRSLPLRAAYEAWTDLRWRLTSS